MRNPFGHHHAEPQQPYQAIHGVQYPPREIVKIYCEADPGVFLACRNGGVVMAPANESDPSQQWIIYPSWRVKAKDDEGFPAFALLNKVGASHGVPPTRGEQSSFYLPQANVEPQGHLVRIHCEANPEFFLAARGDVAVLALENPQDPHQQWIKVDSWGLRIKDAAGNPAFALVNKATRHALKHGDKEWDQIFLAHYNHDKKERSVLWALGADVVNGYQYLRPVNNFNLNMDGKAADGHVGGIRDGNKLILLKWKNQSNQKWNLQDIY